MALTSISDIREIGGIDDPDAYLLFRLASDAALNTQVQKALNWATAWLRSRVASATYSGSATANIDIDEVFKAAEQDLSLYRLMPRLKARRLLGTHYAFDQEGTERFEEYIDVELLRSVEISIEPFVNIGVEPEQPFALPAFVATGVIDPADLLTVEEQIQTDIDESLGGVDPTLAVTP